MPAQPRRHCTDSRSYGTTREELARSAFLGRTLRDLLGTSFVDLLANPDYLRYRSTFSLVTS